ncbi:MAG: hypothetical protein ACRD96_27635, partial [Bryobacteraceae bacterium]
MTGMSSVILPLLLFLAQAEVFEKAPPDVDQALRERIRGFYQAHVDGKARLADQYVAEDAKDFFYNKQKPRYLKFDLNRIYYSDNFTKAKAVVVCEQRIPMPGFADKPMTLPVPSLWKQVEGKWYWYVDVTPGKRETPFGTMTAGATPGAAKPPAGLTAGPTVESLWSQVQTNRSAVALKAGAKSSAQVTISSQMAGSVSLSIEAGDTPGLEFKLDRTAIKTGETAVLTVTADRKEPLAAIIVGVRVQPTTQLLPVRVAVDLPRRLKGGTTPDMNKWFWSGAV